MRRVEALRVVPCGRESVTSSVGSLLCSYGIAYRRACGSSAYKLFVESLERLWVWAGVQRVEAGRVVAVTF